MGRDVETPVDHDLNIFEDISGAGTSGWMLGLSRDGLHLSPKPLLRREDWLAYCMFMLLLAVHQLRLQLRRRHQAKPETGGDEVMLRSGSEMVLSPSHTCKHVWMPCSMYQYCRTHLLDEVIRYPRMPDAQAPNNCQEVIEWRSDKVVVDRYHRAKLNRQYYVAESSPIS